MSIIPSKPRNVCPTCCPVCGHIHRDGYLSLDRSPIVPQCGTLTCCLHCAALLQFRPLYRAGGMDLHLVELPDERLECLSYSVQLPLLRLRQVIRQRIARTREAALLCYVFSGRRRGRA